MSISYSFEEKVTESKRNLLLIKLPNEYNLVDAYLNITIRDKALGDWVLEGIDKVLSRSSEYEERDGEVFGAGIKKDITTIYETLEEENPKKQTIPTQDLRELVVVWTKAISDFKNNK